MRHILDSCFQLLITLVTLLENPLHSCPRAQLPSSCALFITHPPRTEQWCQRTHHSRLGKVTLNSASGAKRRLPAAHASESEGETKAEGRREMVGAALQMHKNPPKKNRHQLLAEFLMYEWVPASRFWFIKFDSFQSTF